MIKYQKYLASCLSQLGEGGQKEIAGKLGVDNQQVYRWKNGLVSMKELHFRALRDLMREKSKEGVRQVMDDSPRCPLCNEEILIKKVNRGIKYCRSGYVMKTHQCKNSCLVEIKSISIAKSKDEILFALTRIITE